MAINTAENFENHSPNLAFQVAGFQFKFVNQTKNFKLSLPDAYQSFTTSEDDLGPIIPQKITFSIKNSPENFQSQPEHLVFRTEFWELSRDIRDRLILTHFRGSPNKCILIEKDYVRGSILTNFASSPDQIIYPLQDMDIIIMANWLASFGEMILHASGVIIEGEAYIFIGPSSEGKSTIARYLETQHQLKVLGEDNLILRKQAKDFWIFGTPWHEDPRYSSPEGAPLKKVFFLEKNHGEYIEILDPVDALTRIMQTAFIPYYRQELLPKILSTLSDLSRSVQFYRLAYKLGSDPLGIIHNA